MHIDLQKDCNASATAVKPQQMAASPDGEGLGEQHISVGMAVWAKSHQGQDIE